MTMPTPTPSDDGRPDADAAAPAGQSAPPAIATPADDANDAAPEPEIGDRWGTFPTPERRAALDARLAEWAAMSDHGTLLGPFDRGGWRNEDGGTRLTGADVYFLAARALVGLDGTIADGVAQLQNDPFVLLLDLHLEHANLRLAHLEHANLRLAHLEQAYLSLAHLEQAYLTRAHLEQAYLGGAHLEQAYLGGAHLEHADLSLAHLAHADLSLVHLAHANLHGTHLAHAALTRAYLEHTNLGGAHLEHTNLNLAHLEQAYLGGAHLEQAELRYASFDGDTDLSDASLGTARWWERFVPWSQPITAALGDIHWGGIGTVDLTRIKGNWEGVERLGDERSVRWRDGAEEHASVVRVYRQVATHLRAQGMNEPADRFTYRAYVLNRGVLLRRFRLPQYLGSWLLAILAGYGFRPGRTILCYLATLAFFAYAYIQVTHGLPLVPPLGPLAPDGLLRFGTSASIPPLPPSEALILSVSSFHGRGFFQPLKSLGDPVAGLAAVEAVLGLLIEVSFIATFTQRFFGK